MRTMLCVAHSDLTVMKRLTEVIEGKRIYFGTVSEITTVSEAWLQLWQWQLAHTLADQEQSWDKR